VLQGSGLGQIKGEQERFLEIHTVAVRLRKQADEWLVTGATHLRDERQPSPGALLSSGLPGSASSF
jgi:hypothetical protein